MRPPTNHLASGQFHSSVLVGGVNQASSRPIPAQNAFGILGRPAIELLVLVGALHVRVGREGRIAREYALLIEYGLDVGSRRHACLRTVG